MGFLSRFVPSFLREQNLTPSQTTTGIRTFTESAPHFAPFDGSLYEQDMTRAIVERISSACSKLKPEFVTPDGSTGVSPRVRKLFETWPSDDSTWPDFLRRLATVLYTDTTAYVVPQYDEYFRVVGLDVMKPSYVEVVEYGGEPYIVFHTASGEALAYEFHSVGILTRFQYRSDIFGGGNVPLTPTLRLMDAQRQAEELALKNGARIRFIGKLSMLANPEVMEEKRNKFGKSNLGPSNTSGMMVYDNSWETIQQIKEQSYTIDPDEMARIDKKLYVYFGINEKILTNSYDEATWAAFYEGVVEPFAIMLGEQLTKMLLTRTQRTHGNHIMFSSSYLEYATPESKLKVIRESIDRGIITINEARDIQQLPRIDGGDVRVFRGEYYLVDEDNNVVAESGGHNSSNTKDYATNSKLMDKVDGDGDGEDNLI